MTKTLVLIRHGKAVAREEWQGDDLLRPLTEGGIRSLEAKLSLALTLLDCKDREGVRVWTSSALRASRTADIVAMALGAAETPGAGKTLGIAGASGAEKTLGTAKPIECESLRDQDAEGFLREFEECDAPCVVAVGHNPFMDDLAARLTGVGLPFSTGAVAALRVEERPSLSEGPSARLLWFVQGPRAGRFSNVVELEEIVLRAAEAVDARLSAFFDDPEDPETMHKLRVSIRTMRSLVAFIEPWQKPSQNRRMQKALRTIVRHTSRLRELDVLLDQADALEPPCEELSTAISSVRDLERTYVLKKLSGKRSIRLLESVHACAGRLEWRAAVAGDGVSRKAVRARFGTMLASLERDMEALDLRDAEATHDVRKNAKRVRYSAENFAAFLDADAVDVARRMVKTQDGLGVVCDARVNLAIIDEFPAKGLSSDAISALGLLKASNESVLRGAFSPQDGDDAPSSVIWDNVQYIQCIYYF